MSDVFSASAQEADTQPGASYSSAHLKAAALAAMEELANNEPEGWFRDQQLAALTAAKAGEMDDHWPKSEAAIRVFLKSLAEVAHQAPVSTAEGVGDDAEKFGICGAAFREGDDCLTDIELGSVHAWCCGPEREAYVNLDTGEPIGPDEPIPTPWKWSAL